MVNDFFHMTANHELFDGMVIFCHVVNCKGFSAAANLTGHSTSFISKEINKLEGRVGARLLNRTTRSISLTPEGEAFYSQCTQLIDGAQQAVAALSSTQVTPTGVLKLSCPVSFGNHYLQPILAEYMSRYPNVTLDLDLNDRKVDVVQDGYDLVIRATAELEESTLIARKIFSSKALTVASPAYLQKFGCPKTPQDLVNHQCICYSNLKQPNKWRYTNNTGVEQVVELPIRMLCNSSDMELAMTINGHGITRLPQFAMEQALAQGLVKEVLSDYRNHPIDVYAVYPSRKHLSPKVRCLIDLLVEKFE